jgi:hypothetical protein
MHKNVYPILRGRGKGGLEPVTGSKDSQTDGVVSGENHVHSSEQQRSWEIFSKKNRKLAQEINGYPGAEKTHI